MFFLFKNTLIHYKVFLADGEEFKQGASFKTDDEVILFLHGWGGEINSFLGVINCFKSQNCLAVDFPPFGKSGSPAQIWDIFDYKNMILALLKRLNIKKIKIISHSFGGRVAILLASNYNRGCEIINTQNNKILNAKKLKLNYAKKSKINKRFNKNFRIKNAKVFNKQFFKHYENFDYEILIKKIILVDSAGMKPRFNLKTKCKILKYKLLKKLGFKQENKGSSDYKNLSPIMKKTFSNVVNFFLEEYAKHIKAETLIIFGEKDKAMPVYMGKRLQKLIPDSALLVFKNASHFAYLDNFSDFVIIAKNFLK